jgi:uncharacterized protein with HEPN domain
VSSRSIEKLIGDLLDACEAAQELVGRGRHAYDSDRLLRLAAEAIIGRVGDAAAKLRDRVGDALPDSVPWEDVIANRIVVDHVYHRVDYVALWNTLERDVPELRGAIQAWKLPG